MTEQLKPCPFCGGAASVSKINGYVSCAHHCYGKYNPKEIWNTRPLESALEAQVAQFAYVSDMHSRLREVYDEIDSHVDGSSIVLAKDLLRSAFPEVLK